MGFGNQPALTAMEEGKDRCSITAKPSGVGDGGWTNGPYSFGDDIISFPFNSMGYDNFTGPDIQGDCRTYPPDLNCLPDPKTDGILLDVKSEMYEFCRESEMAYSVASTRGLHDAIDGNNSVPANGLMNTATAITSTDHGKSEVHMNFMPPRCQTGTGYPIKAHGAEAKNSRMSRLQMSGEFSSSESSTSLLPLVDNIGASGNENDINIVPLSISSQQKVDRDFLTLGIGSGMEIRPNNNFSTREIASKLEQVSSQCNNSIGRHCLKNPLNLIQSMDRAAMVRTSAAELSSSACNLASRTPTLDEGGFIGDAGCMQNSVSFPGLLTPQANAQPNFTAKCFTSVFDSTPLSLPFANNLISQPKCGTQPDITTSTYFVNQLISCQQDFCRNSSMKVPSESSRDNLSHWYKQSPISHVQLGNLIPLPEGRAIQTNADVHFPESVQPAKNLTSITEGTRTEAANIVSFRSRVQPVGHLDTYGNIGPAEALGNNLFPERIGCQISKSGTFQSAAAGPFPKRLGLQHNDFAAARTTRGQVIPVAKFDVRPQASPIVSNLSLKRKATENSTNARSGQRRKIFPQPVNSAPGQRQSSPATSAPIPTTVHIPPAPLHVKWQGFDGPLEPAGEKCLLCKRGLSFTAEGLMYQPATPPPVAVLRCGHTFHDHCLQKITPEDQLNNPPCIPCAIGET